jgi:hypothetical protein
MPDLDVEPLTIDQEREFSHAPGESLALVDVETYPVFVGAKADRLDMMAHFSEQMRALTVLSWKAPEEASRFRLIITEDDYLIDRISRTTPMQIASGTLRTYGILCLATHNHLFHCARHRTHDLLQVTRRSQAAQPEKLEVPPGVYAISLYYETPFHTHYGQDRMSPGPEIDYTLILRHYAFPPPRIAPVRLSAGFIPWVGDEAAAQAWAGRGSHKNPV